MTHLQSTLLLALLTPLAMAQPVLQDLFIAGEQGYMTYRIPGILSQGKTVLAYAEARRDGFGDWADIDIVMRRSADGGRTWAPLRVLADAGKDTVNNPVAIPGAQPGEIHFLYCVNYAKAFHMRSTDGGLTFSKPVEITAAFERLRSDYNWNVIATGPGHGIRLRNGRLLVAVWLSTGGTKHRPSRVSTLFSDDNGASWKTGDLLPDVLPNPSETFAVERRDGSVMLNIRNESAEHRRAVSVSPNGATGWSTPKFQPQLLEPVCMASLIRHPKGGLIFSNPDTLEATYVNASKTINRDRKNLTVQYSGDDGETWTAKRVLEPELSGYSDLAATEDGTILTLFERGGLDKSIFRTGRLTVARFSLEWLRGEPDWAGVWQGELTNFPLRPGAPKVKVTMELGPFPTAEGACATMKNTYREGGEVKGVKDYKLCRTGGELFIDEGGGVRLAARWEGDALITPFRVRDLLLISTFRRHGEVLEEEIVSMDDKTLRIRNIQRLTLRRAAEE